MKNIIIHSVIFLFSLSLVAQQAMDTIEEVHLIAQFSPKLQTGFSVKVLNDSILDKEGINMSGLLRKYSNLYIKELGSGMVASVAMRGTGASHTAVYWNGIPINSSLNGQTDFNTISPSLFNRFTVRKGGGSVLLGSGAIGGAVNLENVFRYNKGINANISTSFGSYNTKSLATKVSFSTDKLALQMGQFYTKSDNDYQFLGTDLMNENGEYTNSSLYYGFAYKPIDRHHLFFQSLTSVSDRNTSRTLFVTNKANLWYKTNALIGGWRYVSNSLKITYKTSFVKENYVYVFDKSTPDNLSDNQSKNWLNSLEAKYKFNSKLLLVTGLSHEHIKGDGTNITPATYTKKAVFMWLHHKPINWLVYNISLRKAYSNRYDIPFLYAVDTRYTKGNHSIRMNYSTNYKMPTFNDLYWDYGGNPNLIPEESHSAELGYTFQYKKKALAELNLFRINSTNLIKWQPVSGSLWQPFNIQEVRIAGVEVSLEQHFDKEQHHFLWASQYSYTESKDKKTDLQLLYVPYHLAHSNLDYNYQKWGASVGAGYTGKSYITSSNTEFVSAYTLLDVAANRQFFKNKLHLNLAVLNLLNKSYQIVANRPMPGRHYKLSINYKF